MISARPTAVNLSFEVNNCFQLIEQGLHQNQDKTVILKKLIEMGLRQLEESFLRNSQMAKIGVEVLESTLKKSKWNLMTHCNTGFLACGSLGTALGVISHAHSLGKVEHVYADETRPFMQGTRLTAYELSKQNIPYSLVVEGAASFLLSNKMVDAIFVGADRIAANGDTANKVGTSTLAIVAKFYNIPFYVVAPVSSFDLSLSSGQDIQIEMRSMEEITELKGFKLAPDGAKSVNPSFDVTDHQLITGIICEKGLINPRKKDELIRVVNL
jgi:methylthioribose-1-phosphate isomerase